MTFSNYLNQEFKLSQTAFLYTLQNLPKAKNIVVNIGLNSLVHDTGLLNIRSFKNFIKDIAELINSKADRNIVIVVSNYLDGVKTKYLPGKTFPSKESGLYSALIAMVHNDLANLFCDGFGEYSLNAIGVSLSATGQDNASELNKNFKNLESIAFSSSKNSEEKIDAIKALLNSKKTIVKQTYQQNRIRKTADTLKGLFRHFPRTIPIVMEDALLEQELGDEEFAARIATAINADVLVAVSKKGMLYTTDPKKTNVNQAKFYCYDTGRKSPFEETRKKELSKKLNAAIYANNHGVPILLTSNNKPFAITNMFATELTELTETFPTFTLFINSQNNLLPIEARCILGKIIVDSNAAKIISSGKSSLLLAGVTKIEGNFNAKSVVLIESDKGVEIAKGVVNCPSNEIKNYNKDFELISHEKMRLI